MTGQRSAVQKSSRKVRVLSAADPNAPPPRPQYRCRSTRPTAPASIPSRCRDGPRGTSAPSTADPVPDRGRERVRPCFATAAPTPSGCLATPGRRRQAEIGAVPPAHVEHDQPRPFVLQPRTISPRHCSHSVYFRPRYGLLIGRSWQRAEDLAHRLQPPMPLLRDRFERRVPHRGMRIPDQRHRRRRRGVTRRAFGCTDLAPRPHTAVEEHLRLSRMARRREKAKVRRHRTQLRRRRDRGAHLFAHRQRRRRCRRRRRGNRPGARRPAHADGNGRSTNRHQPDADGQTAVTAPPNDEDCVTADDRNERREPGRVLDEVPASERPARTDTMTIANRPRQHRASAPNSAGASSSTGQCHRYQE